MMRVNSHSKENSNYKGKKITSKDKLYSTEKNIKNGRVFKKKHFVQNNSKNLE